MHYTKEYKLITPNYDLKKINSFLLSHNYVLQDENLFDNTKHYLKSMVDDFQNIFEISILIVDNKDELTFEVNSVNSDAVHVGIMRYMKLLTETCVSILVHDDFKEEVWKKFYDHVKKRKQAFTIGKYILDVIDVL
ncbi:MAG: hypothetical protein JEZ05_07795 [Tenericutes bacterium]|nr:hypothetical protein [Mycoplasmatota bacterium]